MYFMYDLFGVLVGYIFVADSFHTFRGFVVKGLNIMYVTFIHRYIHTIYKIIHRYKY